MKKLIIMILAMLVVFMACIAFLWEPIIDALPIDQSGWKTQDGTTWYLNEKGDPLTGWQEIDGNRYYFHDENGAMVTGLTPIDLEHYYLDESGVMQTGWIDGKYFAPAGPMATGLTEIYGQMHYFLSDGSPAFGWAEVNGTLCYFGEKGTFLSGWQEIDGNRYYLDESSSPVTGWLELDGNRYYLDENGILQTGWVELGETRHYLNEEGILQSGWVDIDGTRYYLNEDGTPGSEWVVVDEVFYRLNEDGTVYSGWLPQDIGTFYINEDGTVYLGWLEENGVKYYLRPDTGTLAKGTLEIDGKTYFFTSTGANIILVNPWNYIPEDYEVELVELDNGKKVAKAMYESLMQMLADCEAAGHRSYVRSAYRTHADQQANFNRILVKYNNDRKKAAQVVALPGTSEHQLGLAVDITDYSYRELDYEQEKTATQKWLMEHCWEYGFILRYPSEKSTITGIIYEPWHYRYVGLELSQELKELGICLEEYMDMLTGDGTTCGGT